MKKIMPYRKLSLLECSVNCLIAMENIEKMCKGPKTKDIWRRARKIYFSNCVKYHLDECHKVFNATRKKLFDDMYKSCQNYRKGK